VKTNHGKKRNPNQKPKSQPVNPVVKSKFDSWRADWNLFAKEVLRVNLDPEQQAILRSVQFNKMTSVASGTARGKDYVAAVCGMCFLYLTPKWDDKGTMIENTKVALTAPTDRQVGNIMYPEITRIYHQAKFLPGRLVAYDIRTDNEEWFLTGFKADEHKQEAWTGFHAVHTMFVVTEGSGIAEVIYGAIEGNLQGDSRILIVYNDNTGTGYAAETAKSKRWEHFRLSSLTAPNVLQKKIVVPGQVDYQWVKDKVETWCRPIYNERPNEIEGDFQWEGGWYRPNDLFRVKVLGLGPKVSSDVLVPGVWIEMANERWKKFNEQGFKPDKPLRLGNDVAGMGRDNSCFVRRYGNYVKSFEMFSGRGEAVHMQVAGKVKNMLQEDYDDFTGKIGQAFIDTIGEGAGVYSRLQEQAQKKGNEWIKVFSCKFSEAATDDGDKPLQDITGVYKFLNMRAYTYWAIRDWLNPEHKSEAMLPPDPELFQELTQTKWKFRSDGSVQIEDKKELVKRIKRSPDKADALANTFWPVPDIVVATGKKKNIAKYFH
jgi:hypothetical protein